MKGHQFWFFPRLQPGHGLPSLRRVASSNQTEKINMKLHYREFMDYMHHAIDTGAAILDDFMHAEHPELFEDAQSSQG